MLRGLDLPIIGSKTTGLNRSPGASSSVLSSAERKANRRKSRERRWTVGIEREQLPLHADSIQQHYDDSSLHLPQNLLSQSVSSTSLASIDSDFGSVSEFSNPTALFSQQDLLQEMALWSNPQFMDPSNSLVNHQHHLSYEQAIDNFPLSPSNYGVMSAQQISLCNHIIHELVTTERSYVNDLTNIIEGYYTALTGKVGQFSVTEHDIAHLFGNIEEIRNFNQSLLDDLQACGRDIHRIAHCFIYKAEAFKIYYTQYCNNYPRSVEMLVRLSNDKSVAIFLKTCQRKLNHLLPLGTYLLKPVQRVLKYSLLLRNIAKHVGPSDVAYHDLQIALVKMIRVAEHINAMKKKYDAATVVQELQHLLHGWEGPNLTVYGDIVYQDAFRVAHSSRSGVIRPHSAGFRSGMERYVFLFQKMLLIVKKKEEGYLYKHHAEMKDMQLTEHLKDPHSFQIRQISTKSSFTFQARTVEQKEDWTKKIKQLLMESVPHLPDKAKLLILAGFPTDLRKTEGTSPTSSDRRKKLQSGRTSPQPPALDEQTPGARLITGKLNLSATLPSNLPSSETNMEDPSKLSLSLSSVGIAGLTSRTRKHKEDEFAVNEPSEASGSHNFWKKRTHMATLPFPLVESWQRSDSEPALIDSNPSVETTRSQTNSPEHQRTLSRIRSVSSHSENSSPIPHVIVSLPTKDDSELDTTLQPDEVFSPEPGNQTLINSDLPLSGPPSRTSSPSLNLGSLSTSSNSLSHGNEDSTVGFGNGGNVAPSTTSSRSSSSSLKETTVGVVTNTQAGYNLQQSHGSDAQQEIASHPPPTIFTNEEGKVHHGSDNHYNLSMEASTQSGSALPDTLSTELSVSPEPSCLSQEEDDLQKSFVIQSTPEATGCNKVIHLLPVDEEISEELNVAIIDPPSMFATIPSPDVPQYTIDTESDQEANENDQEQLLLDLISNNTESKQTSSSPLIPVTDDATAIQRILSQPQEYSEDEIPESHESSPVNVRPPKQFDGPPKEVSGDDEIVTPLASPVPLHRQQEQLPSLTVEAEETTPKASPLFVHKVYQRRGTPYTSIEDLPTAEDKDNTTVIPCPPQFASPSLGDLLMIDDEPAPLPAIVKRSHSFEHKYRLAVHQPDDDVSPRSNKSNGNRRANTPEGFKKLSAVVHRAHSFSKTRRVQRPISVIGLVHSTRDTSDLVDLDDAMRFSRLATHRASQSPESSEEVIDAKKTTSLTDLERQINPLQDPSPDSSSNKATMGMVKRESSFHYLSSVETKPVRERRQRWSLLRSNRHQRKPKRDRARETVSSPASDDDRPQANTINILPYLTPGESTTAPLPATHGQEQNLPGSNLNIRGEQAVVEGSLFSKPTAFHSPHSSADSDWDKSDIFFGVEVTEGYKQESQVSPSPPPAFDVPDSNRNSNKVQKLAREYSRKIKDRRDHLATTSDIHEEGSSSSQVSQNQQSCSTLFPDQQLDWMQLIKNRKAGKQRLTSSPDITDDSDTEVLEMGVFQSDFQPGHEHSLSTFSEPSTLLRNGKQNTGSPVPPSTAEQKRTRHESYTDTSITSVEEALDVPRDSASGRIRHAGSEAFLTSSYGVSKSPEFDDIRKRTKFGGWVKSLVHKFSSK